MKFKNRLDKTFLILSLNDIPFEEFVYPLYPQK